ncbi:phage tail tape measure protein [Delftia deserti]|uniref:Phage tail tape measure protein n=1 Tax=Delftia deserti TaxID=1651218 RepID=A0ABW5ENL7_9BURK
MDKLKLQVLLDLADRVTAPLKRIGAGARSVGLDVSGTQDALRKLQQQQAAVGKANAMQASLRETQAKLQAARTAKAALVAEMLKGGEAAKAAGGQYRAAGDAVQKLAATYQRQIDQTKRLRAGLAEMGITNAAQAEGKLREAIDRTTKALERQRKAHELVSKQRAAVEANKTARADARGALFDGAAMAASLAAPLKMAVDFESSMADVDKVMDLDKSGLEEMSSYALDLSKRLPMAAKDIAQILALGGQSGLTKKQLKGDGDVGFAEHAIKMGVAFGMTAEESGEAMAKMKSGFGMTIPEVATLTDKINLLGNTGAASEKQILGIVTRVGPLGAVAGTASGELAAMASTLAGMGVQEEVAATGIKNMILAMVAGESASKSQKEGFKQLGLDSTKVAKSMQKDAAGTMVDLLKRVKKLDKYRQASVLQSIFQKESILAIAPMLSQLDTLKENLDKVNDAAKYGGAVNAEYDKRAATTANRLKLASNQAAAMGISLGNILLPALNDGLSILSPWMERLAALTQAFPGTTRAIVLFTAALIVGKVSAIAITFVYGLMKGALLAVRGAFVAARLGWMLYTGATVAGTVATRGAILASWALTAVQIAGRIATVAVAGAMYLLFGVVWTLRAGLVAARTAWLLYTGASIAASKAGMFATGVTASLTAAQWLLNLALSANPIALVVAGVAALIGVGILLYKYWEPIGRFFGKLWGRMTGGLDEVKQSAAEAGKEMQDQLGDKAATISIGADGKLPDTASTGQQMGQRMAEAAGIAIPAASTQGMDQAAMEKQLKLVQGSAIGKDKGGVPGLSAAAPVMAGGTYNFTIHAAPGMDPKEVAKAVATELDKRERANKSRVLSQLSDTEG